MFPMESYDTDALILLRGVLQDEAVASFVRALQNDDIAAYARAEELLLAEDMQNSFAAYLTHKILCDDNLFARRAFAGTLNNDICQAYSHDLAILQDIAKKADNPSGKVALAADSGFPSVRYGKDDDVFGKNWGDGESLQKLVNFYRHNGYGIYIGHKAFTFENKTLKPVRNTSDITLSDLKDYEAEKKAIEDNTINFISGLPYSNMLLYGDKGTGKSSTIHAVLNKYAEKGLRAVEIPKDQIKDINAVKEVLAGLPFKFFIFIDDLSLEEHDEKVTSLKASLEGSLTEKGANVMIVATSNRRHILKENFSDRENSVHARDTMEEQLSLSDRFGLTVYFSSTGKSEYLSIIRQLAADRKLKTPQDDLFALAERWALLKGGRSPRRARQFIDFAFACEAKNQPIEF